MFDQYLSLFNNPVVGYIIVITSILIGMVSFFFWFIDARIYDMNGKLLPGPKSNFFLPSVGYSFIQGRKEKVGTKYIVQDILCKYGDGSTFSANIYGNKILFTCNPEHLKVILSGSHTKFPKDIKYNRLKFLLGEGLVTAQDEKWRSHRHLVNPSFHAEALKSFVEIFNEVTLNYVKEIKENTPSIGSSFKLNMNKLLSELTMDIICRSAFGFKKVSRIDEEFEKHFNNLNNEINERIMDHTDWWHLLFPKRTKETKVALEWILGRLNNTIAKRIEARLDSKYKAESENRMRDLLDILLDASDGSNEAKLSSKEFSDHTLTFFAAGFETTSGALSWTLVELCKNPDVLKKCHEEIDKHYDQLLDKDSRGLRYEAIAKLEYITQVMKEAMRLHPPVPAFGRSNREPTQLGEYLIKPGTNLIVLINSLHRNPEYWTNPDLFDPDRWSPDNINTTLKSPFQYAPFSHGPRNCIGQRFAQMEMSIVLAILLRHYTVSMTESDFNGIEHEEIITQHPRNLQMTLTRRI